MNEIQIKEHSKKNVASYSFGIFALEFMKFYSIYFFFYETEVLLGVWLLALANIIFAIWNAINDPLVGYFTDKTFRFTKKWGKRFPWIMVSGVPIFILIIFLFTPPNVNPLDDAWILFAYVLILLCVIDTLISIWHVNTLGMFPDKFRSDKERRNVAAYTTIMGQIATIIATLVPPLLYSFGNKGSYAVMASVMAIIGISALILMIPGVREDKEMIERYFQREQQTEKDSFFGVLKTALKQKNFVVYIVTYLLWQASAALLQTSIPYFTKYVLGMQAAIQTIISAGLLIGLLGAVPVWTVLSKKYGFGKIYLASAFLMGICAIPLLFASDIISTIIAIIILAIPTGGYWVMLMPVFSDVIDEAVVVTNKRQEGIYMGIRTFMARFSIIIQTLVMAIVHTLTNFVDNAPVGTDTQPLSAIWGIRIHIALFPIIFMILAGIIIWLFYDITDAKKKGTQAKLLELKL